MSNDLPPPVRQLDLPAKQPQQAHIPVFDSQALLGDREEVWIQHAGQRYILHKTRQGKLLMTKS